jgi:hypothetical protein
MRRELRWATLNVSATRTVDYTDGGPPMYLCTICRFATELDDVVAAAANGQCVCLRCYGRETDSALSMPKALQRDITDALNAIGLA